MTIKVTLDQQEIMELVADAIAQKFEYGKTITWEDVVFDVTDTSGDRIVYENIEAYVDGIE